MGNHIKIKKIKLKNFLSFGPELTEIDLSDVTHIVGPNDSGKTNLIRAVRLVIKILRGEMVDPQEYFHDRNELQPFSIEIELKFSESEKEVLINSFICSFTYPLYDRLKNTINGEGTFISNSQSKILRTLIANRGRVLFQPLIENTVTLNLLGPEKFGFPPELSLKFSRDDKNVYFYNFGTITADPKAPSSYGWLSFEKGIIEEFKGLIQPLSREKEQDSQSVKAVLEEKDLDIFNIVDKNKDSPTPMAYEMNRSRIINLETQFDDFQPIKEIYSFYISRGVRISPDYLIGPYDLIRDIFINSLYVSSNASNGLSFFPYGTSTFDAEEQSSNKNLVNDLGELLFQLKNNKSVYGKRRYKTIRETFENLLPGKEFEVYSELRPVKKKSRGEFVLTTSDIAPNPFGINKGTIPLNLEMRVTEENITYYSIEVGNTEFKIPLDLSSHGVLQTLIISTVLSMSEGNIVIMDEPEIGLHPNLQKKIIKLIEEKSGSGSQFILITHSPFFMNSNWIENTVRITMEDGKSRSMDIHDLMDGTGKYDRLIPKTDFRNLLFSKGVIIVEGIGDRIALELVDRYSSSIEGAPGISENEWMILESGGVESFKTNLKFVDQLGLKWVLIGDIDSILLVRRRSLPATFQALSDSGNLPETTLSLIKENLGLLMKSDGEDAKQGIINKLKKIAEENDVFVFEKDIERALGIDNHSRDRKPIGIAEAMSNNIRDMNFSYEIQSLFSFLLSRIV